MQQHVRSKCGIHQKFLRRIGNRHGKPPADGHGKKCRIDKTPLRQAKRNIRQTTDRRKLPDILTIRDGIITFFRSLWIGSDCGNQPIHDNILVCHSQLHGTVIYGIDNLMLFFGILWQSLIGKRKQDKHSPVLFCQRKHMLDFFCLKGNGVDQCSSRIDTQCLFHNINMAGIEAKRTIYRRRNFIDHLLHHFFFVNAVHSHIDVKDGCPVFLLRHCHLTHKIQFSFAQLGLQFFLSGRIDPFPDHQEIAIQTNFYIFALRRKNPAMQCKRPVKFHPPRCIRKCLDMFFCCTAASTYNGCSRFYQCHTCPGKFFRCHAVHRFLSLEFRESGVWLCDERNRSIFCHLFHQRYHLHRTGRTVYTDRIHTQRLQYDHSRLRRCSK